MATLADGVQESDVFSLTRSDAVRILHRVSERILAIDIPDQWSLVSQALRETGVCLVHPSGDIVQLLLRLIDCTTCGEALDVLGRVRPSKASERVHQDLWDVDMEAAKRAWEIEYVVSSPVLDLVATQLNQYLSWWNKSQWYAPLVALVQSSGWGKSRLICQLWRKDFYVFYVSCMGEQQAGFPRRTGKLADILQNQESTEATFVALVFGILTVLNEKSAHGMTCKEWIEAQEKSNEIQEQVHAMYVEKLKEIAVHDKLDRKDAELQFELALTEVTGKLAERQVKLLLCVDEAGELRENFVTLRRSLRSVPVTKNFLSIVLGTDRKVADLAAAAEDDASARVRLATPYSVFHPLYLIGKSDIFSKAGSDISKTSMAPKDVIRYGRPLWAVYYDSVKDANKLNATIQLAMRKLLGKNVDTSKPGWVTRDIAVAVFSCIVGLEVVAWGSLPQQLVAMHMRTIVSISQDRRRVYTAAVVEPVLAAAAAMLLHTKDDAFLGEFLDRLIEVFLDGLVLEGVRGEVAIRIIIMLAMHECTKKEDYIQHVTLARFLETMFGKSIVDKLREHCCDLDCHLFFNSFTPISAEPFKQLVEEAFARCTALIARRNESILDFALPVRVAISDVPRTRPMQESVKVELENQEPKGVVVSGQVKNRRHQKSMKSDIEKLQNDDRMSTPVQLFFSIGHGGGEEPEVRNDTVVAYGLDCFQHLKSESMQMLKVVDKLRLLLKTCEDVFKGATPQERAVLEGMIPLGLASKSFLDDMEVEDESWVPMKWKGSKKRSLLRQHQVVQKGEVEDVQMGEADAQVKTTQDVQTGDADLGTE